MSFGYRTNRKVKIAVSTMMLSVAMGVSPSLATDMTAGVVLERMDAKERFSYVYGLVEGLAYARFRKDTLSSGAKDETGMKCIYGWFFARQESVISDVEAAFRKYADHIPAVIVATMLKKECGE